MQGEFAERGGIGCVQRCGAVYPEPALAKHLSPSAKKSVAQCKADLERRRLEEEARRLEKEAREREEEARQREEEARRERQRLEAVARGREEEVRRERQRLEDEYAEPLVSRHCMHIVQRILTLHCPKCDPPAHFSRLVCPARASRAPPNGLRLMASAFRGRPSR
jgi:hypothetical protein